jgi:acyl-coenzyme A synthetase/AMP-(fatty) acid ligase
VFELVSKYRPTVFFSVPTFYAKLLREAERCIPDFCSVRLAVSAGEALPAELFERFRQRFGLEILDGIGSTEMLHMFISTRPGAARPGTCGTEVPNYDAKIVDAQDESVRDGEIGNLWVKGQSGFAGYWNKPELTARTRQGDWVNTGDKFFRDAGGHYHYCGRADDMMKVGLPRRSGERDSGSPPGGRGGGGGPDGPQRPGAPCGFRRRPGRRYGRP